MGFVPLAYRAGSREKGRVHIFWQRRIRAGDEKTPYWFPSQTTGGSIREDRLVLPIPPGTHWGEAKPVVLPGMERSGVRSQGQGGIADRGFRIADWRRCGASRGPREDGCSIRNPRSEIRNRTFPPAPCGSPRAGAEPEPKPKREPKPKVKNDPRLVAAARELRDRYLEHVNGRAGRGKYDVSRRVGRDFPRAAAALPVAGRAALPAPSPRRRRGEKGTKGQGDRHCSLSPCHPFVISLPPARVSFLHLVPRSPGRPVAGGWDWMNAAILFAVACSRRNCRYHGAEDDAVGAASLSRSMSPPTWTVRTGSRSHSGPPGRPRQAGTPRDVQLPNCRMPLPIERDGGGAAGAEHDDVVLGLDFRESGQRRDSGGPCRTR